MSNPDRHSWVPENDDADVSVRVGRIAFSKTYPKTYPESDVDRLIERIYDLECRVWKLENAKETS